VPEACLILKHQPDGSFTEPVLIDFREDVGEFFFPVFLRGHIGFGLLLVWNQLAPAMTVQQAVGAGQRDLAPQADIQRSFDLADHQDAAPLAFSKNGARKATSSSRVMFSRRRPPLLARPLSGTPPARTKRVRS